jgi:hypothetical protein
MHIDRRHRLFLTLSVCLLSVGFSVLVAAQGATISATVYNQLTVRLTASIDGEFKCDLAPNTNCNFPIRRGQHRFVIRRADNLFFDDLNTIPEAFEELCIWVKDPRLEYDDCRIF